MNKCGIPSNKLVPNNYIKVSEQCKEQDIVARTGSIAAASVGDVPTDVHAEHLGVYTMVVHGVAALLRQGIEVKQVAWRARRDVTVQDFNDIQMIF